MSTSETDRGPAEGVVEMKAQVKSETAEDDAGEDTTASWTSSLASISPDHPLFVSHTSSHPKVSNGEPQETLATSQDVLGENQQTPTEPTELTESSLEISLEEPSSTQLCPTPDHPQNPILLPCPHRTESSSPPPPPPPTEPETTREQQPTVRFDQWPAVSPAQTETELKSFEWQNHFSAPDEQPLGLDHDSDDDDKDQQRLLLRSPGGEHKKEVQTLLPSLTAPRPSPIKEESSMSFSMDETADRKASSSLYQPLLRNEQKMNGDDGPALRLDSAGSDSNGGPATVGERLEPSGTPLRRTTANVSTPTAKPKHGFTPLYASTRVCEALSKRLLRQHYTPVQSATWIGFWALLQVTCANYVLTPMRDAIALTIGVEHMPKLTMASTFLAMISSVPIGWLFEAPDPGRRRVWKRMGLTRGETQGTSLALFYRCFAGILISYAMGFAAIDLLRNNSQSLEEKVPVIADSGSSLWVALGQFLYVAFFLVVNLMKLHSLSLMWGVTSEAMEYEEVARSGRSYMESHKKRLQRLALVGFGGTLGGILGSGLASSMARLLRLPGLLLVAAVLLEMTAELSIELGRIMQKHWEEQQLFKSTDSLVSLDSSMKRSASMGSMKRVASGNSLNRVKSAVDLRSTGDKASAEAPPVVDDDSFMQRLLRGVRTILKSRLLMAIFTYNALYASTTVLLSFQRAALVANRNDSTTTEADTAFLANVNMASSVAIFTLQASGLGAMLAAKCGSRGTLVLMPAIRLAGVLALAWWHRTSQGKPPNLLVFLVVDEATKIMNLAVAKPVRESLWRGLSNEARYEAKPIVDTLANRWGGGSAAFLVSTISRAMDVIGVEPDAAGNRSVLGFPPVIFLCMIVASWWTVVSADLGHIRHRIDMELKKCQ